MTVAMITTENMLFYWFLINLCNELCILMAVSIAATLYGFRYK